MMSKKDRRKFRKLIEKVKEVKDNLERLRGKNPNEKTVQLQLVQPIMEALG